MQYLPDTRTARTFRLVKRRVGYDYWRRRIDRYGGTDDEPERILDVGCGAGYLLACLERWYDADLIGGDVAGSYVRYAADSLDRANVVRFDGTRLPFRAGTFDVVFSLQVVEHVRRPERLVAEAARVLRPRGLFVLTTPNPVGVAATLLGDDWQGVKDDHPSLREPGEWRATIEDAGFSICSEGTTLFSGLPVLGRLPFALLSWVPQAVFGYLPWQRGESYKAVARKGG